VTLGQAFVKVISHVRLVGFSLEVGDSGQICVVNRFTESVAPVRRRSGAMMEEFKVPLVEVQASILLEHCGKIDGTLHVSSSGPAGGPGRVIDRLNDGDPFVPWIENGQADLLSKNGILWVHLNSPERITDHDSVARVSILLSGGNRAHGAVHYLMPRQRSRVLDYLNAAPRFFAVSDDSGSLLVNRDHIVRIREE
jgi:hypothetical protein